MTDGNFFLSVKIAVLRYWFFLGIVLMVMLAFASPGVGLLLKKLHVINVAIFLAFFVTGLTLETASIFGQMKNIKVLAAAILSSLILFPAVAYFPASWLFGPLTDAAIGVLIMGVAPVTLASGTVMTIIARGNVPLSLFICVLGNFMSIFTIPFILNLVLQFGEGAIVLPKAKMFADMVVKIFIPTLAGQLIRPYVKTAMARYSGAVSIFNQCLVLMIILNAVSASTDRIAAAGLGIAGIFAYMLVLHMGVLAGNFAISRCIGLDRPSTAAFTIHTSQKTLTISYIVWAGYFSTVYPMALIPCIAYHLIQMVADTLVAHAFRRRIHEQ